MLLRCGWVAEEFDDLQLLVSLVERANFDRSSIEFRRSLRPGQPHFSVPAPGGRFGGVRSDVVSKGSCPPTGGPGWSLCQIWGASMDIAQNVSPRSIEASPI